MRKLNKSRLVGLLKLIFLAVISWSDGFAAKTPCQLCSCVDSLAGEVVTCTDRNLSTVPRGFPATSYVLRLGRNNLTRISRGDFWNLSRLTYLSLTENKIRYVESGSFENLTNLETLYLRYNEITYLEPGIFNNLTNLVFLDLMYNQIS